MKNFKKGDKVKIVDKNVIVLDTFGNPINGITRDIVYIVTKVGSIKLYEGG